MRVLYSPSNHVEAPAVRRIIGLGQKGILPLVVVTL